jgi:hypothetical protein
MAGFSKFVGGAVVLVACGGVMAEDTKPAESPDAKAARDAAVAFAGLLNQADPAAYRKAFAGDAEAMKLVDVMHDVMQARGKLMAAAIKAFPNEKPPASDDLTAAGLVKRLMRNEVKITGDEATIGADWKLKKTDGAWRVTDAVAHPEGKKMVGTMLPAMTASMNALLPRVEAGEFKTPREMDLAFRDEMQKRMAPPSAPKK